MISNQWTKYLKDACGEVLWKILATSLKHVFQGTCVNGCYWILQSQTMWPQYKRS